MLPDSEQHITHIITDYVLELLPVAEHEAARQHIARCSLCQRAVLREQQIGLEVKKTLTVASDWQRRPLSSSLPGVVNQLSFRSIIRQGQAQILLVSCLLVLAFATLGIQLRLQQNAWLATAPALLSTTVMNTETPTATLLVTSEGSKYSGSVSPTPAPMKAIPLPEAALAPVAVYPAQLAAKPLQ